MKLALFGATGRVGSRLLREAAARGHQVTAFSRQADQQAAIAGVQWVTADLDNSEDMLPLLAGHDAMLTAVHFTDVGAERFVTLARAASIPRLLCTGGAGTLMTASGLPLLETEGFPAHVRPEAEAGRRFLNVLKGVADLDWVFLSPSMLILPGERTGQFRLGLEDLLVGEDGQSRISMEDFAVAMLDELEQPRHSRQRFTVGY